MSTETKEAKKFVSIAEACELFGLGQTRMRELLRQNKIEAVRLGARVLVNLSSATQFFSSLPRLNDE
ncbi:MAG: helix-turn-helix domain-containing protein [Terricaulis sp.]